MFFGCFFLLKYQVSQDSECTAGQGLKDCAETILALGRMSLKDSSTNAHLE